MGVRRRRLVLELGVFAHRFRDQRRPAPRALLWSIAAGAVWPIVVLGVAEKSATAPAAEAVPADEGLAVIV
jgi:hypothetical protein